MLFIALTDHWELYLSPIKMLVTSGLLMNLHNLAMWLTRVNRASFMVCLQSVGAKYILPVCKCFTVFRVIMMSNA